MKKNMIKLLALAVTLLATSSAFAAGITLTAASVYSIGSTATNRAPFKPSPKVSMMTSLASGVFDSKWTVTAAHASAINKAKGKAFFTSSDDPGTYAWSNPSALAEYADVAAAVTAGFAAEN